MRTEVDIVPITKTILNRVMDEPVKPFHSENYDRVWPGRWRDWQALGLLLLLALALRGWVIMETEVPARDSIGFIRYALRFEKENWQEVISSSHQHPGYPLTILVVSLPVRHFTGATDCHSMQLSAQLASSLAGWLLVIPMYFIGKHFFNRSVGFWGSLLFQCLPSSGHTLSDAISDPLFLLLSASTLLFSVRGVNGNSPRPFALSGLFCGLAYLVRPEGALVAIVTLLVLLGMHLVPRWRRPWRTTFAHAAVLIVCTVLVGSPYYLVTGAFTNKPSAYQLTGQPLAETSDEDVPAVMNQGPLFAVHISKTGSTTLRMWLGAKAICSELAHSYQYLAWFPALLGLWWCRSVFRTLPGAWVVLLLFLAHGTLVWWLAVKVGYVSDRHILLLILCSIFQAVAATIQVPFHVRDWLLMLARRKIETAQNNPTTENSPDTPPVKVWPWLLPLPVHSLLLVLLMIGLGLSKTMQPLHAHRTGHYEAGKWLATHSRPFDVIEDDHAWAHFYAGRVFLEENTQPVPPGQKPSCYYVISRASDRRDPTTKRNFEERELISHGARIVFQWPRGMPTDRAKVVVYHLASR